MKKIIFVFSCLLYSNNNLEAMRPAAAASAATGGVAIHHRQPTHHGISVVHFDAWLKTQGPNLTRFAHYFSKAMHSGTSPLEIYIRFIEKSLINEYKIKLKSFTTPPKFPYEDKISHAKALLSLMQGQIRLELRVFRECKTALLSLIVDQKLRAAIDAYEIKHAQNLDIIFFNVMDINAIIAQQKIASGIIERLAFNNINDYIKQLTLIIDQELPNYVEFLRELSVEPKKQKTKKSVVAKRPTTTAVAATDDATDDDEEDEDATDEKKADQNTNIGFIGKVLGAVGLA